MSATATTKAQDLATEAAECFERKEFERAATLLGECLLQAQTSERWNDWATARFFAGRPAEAERGYRRALEMEPQSGQAAENLGTLLASHGRAAEAIPFLERAISLTQENPKPSLTQLLADCRSAAATASDGDRARESQMYDSLTRSLTRQSLALDRALFRLSTLPLEVNDATTRILKSIEELRGGSFSANGSVPAPQKRITTLALDELFAHDLAVELHAPRAVDGNTSIFELVVLNTLLRKFRAKAAFEIGTFDGRTTLNLAANLPVDGHVYTLDLPRTEVGNTRLTLGSGDYPYIAKERSGTRFHGRGEAAKITQLYGDSANFDFSPYEGQIDFVFIDGSHAREYVLNDSRAALKLLRGGKGQILWHDYPGWQTVADAIHELCEKDPAFQGIHYIPETNLAYLEADMQRNSSAA